MLLKSIIGKTLGIKDHVVRRVREERRSLIVELDRHKGRLLLCSRCGKRHRVRDRLGIRQWRHVPLWGIPVFLEYAPARVKCPTYGKVVVEAAPWSAGKTPLSVGLIGLLSTWAKMLAWDAVAGLFDVHWNTVAGACTTWAYKCICPILLCEQTPHLPLRGKRRVFYDILIDSDLSHGQV